MIKFIAAQTCKVAVNLSQPKWASKDNRQGVNPMTESSKIAAGGCRKVASKGVRRRRKQPSKIRRRSKRPSLFHRRPRNQRMPNIATGTARWTTKRRTVATREAAKNKHPPKRQMAMGTPDYEGTRRPFIQKAKRCDPKRPKRSRG